MKRFKTLLAALMLAAVSILSIPTATFAAERAMGHSPQAQIHADFDGKLTDLTDMLTDLGRPLTILAAVLAILSIIAAPALPEWAAENRGKLRGILVAAMVLGLVPDIVDLFMG